MDDRAAFYFAEGLASSTIRTYRCGQERFLKYCQTNSSVAFPVTEVVLCGFAAHLADGGLRHRSIKTYVLGVCFFQIKAGCNDPFQGAPMPRLEYVMRGIKKNEAKTGSGSKGTPSYHPGHPEMSLGGVVKVGR